MRAGRIPARAALGLHCLVTGVVATVAVSLSSVVRHGSDLQRTISRVITGIVVPLLLGLLVTGVAGRTLVVYLALVVLAHLWFERRLAPIQDPVELGARR